MSRSETTCEGFLPPWKCSEVLIPAADLGIVTRGVLSLCRIHHSRTEGKIGHGQIVSRHPLAASQRPIENRGIAVKLLLTLGDLSGVRISEAEDLLDPS